MTFWGWWENDLWLNSAFTGACLFLFKGTIKCNQVAVNSQHLSDPYTHNMRWQPHWNVTAPPSHWNLLTSPCFVSFCGILHLFASLRTWATIGKVSSSKWVTERRGCCCETEQSTGTLLLKQTLALLLQDHFILLCLLRFILFTAW